ncbi:SPOSA6832_00828, partial [Sporobolomyces salmonicolor]
MAAQGGPADPHDVQGYSRVPPEAEPRSRTASAPSPRRRARFDSPLPLSDLADASSTRSASPEPLATPSLSESYGTLKKNLSFKSLRELEIHELSAAVYRKGSRADRRVYRPKDSEEVFAHALRGGIRSLLLGSSLRAFVNLVIVLLRMTRKRGLAPKLVLHALFGQDTIRFGAMLGLFSFLYKWTLHTLRLYNFGPKGAGNEEVWHAAIAGAVSGLSVWAEKPSRRVTIGQQMFVRGLQGHYNILKGRGIIRVKNVSVLVFGFSCAQIMYSWLVCPPSSSSPLLPLSPLVSPFLAIAMSPFLSSSRLTALENRWLPKPSPPATDAGSQTARSPASERVLLAPLTLACPLASRVSEPCLPVNLSAYRNGSFDPEAARKTLEWGRGATGQNAALIEAYAQRAEKGDFGPPFAPCFTVHPWKNTCTATAIDRWHHVFRWIAPVYAGLHVIPPIILRRAVFLKEQACLSLFDAPFLTDLIHFFDFDSPKAALLKSFLGTLRSCSFLATFVTLFQGLVCLQRNIWDKFHGRIPAWLEAIIMHKSYYWFSGFATCLSLFIEERKRRRELAMYVLPRGLESFWSVLRRRSYVPFVPGGEVLLTSVGLSMVMSTYQSSPEMLSGLVRSILYQFIGHG